MPRRPDPARATRVTARLSRTAILDTAISLADTHGLDALSMRRLGTELGVNPMSVYLHLSNKDDLLEAMADSVVAQITMGQEASGLTPSWQEELRALVRAARRTMLTHPWAVQVLQQRDTPTPAMLGHVDRVLGILRRGGCSVELSHHALHLLGSRILGFSQDLFDDSPDNRSDAATLAGQFAGWASTYPHVVELGMAVSHNGSLGGCDDDAEFDFALDVILAGLERSRRGAMQD